MIALAMQIAAFLFLAFIGAIALYFVFIVLGSAVLGTAFAAHGLLKWGNRAPHYVQPRPTQATEVTEEEARHRRRQLLRQQTERVAAEQEATRRLAAQRS